MLDRLEAKMIVLSTCNRYVDDITSIRDVKEKKEEGKLFLILEGELNKLDPTGNGIRVRVSRYMPIGSIINSKRSKS